MLKLLLIVSALMAADLTAGPIGALTPTAAQLVATGGEVRIHFAGQTAGHDSVLNLIEPIGFGGNPFFHNHLTPVGTGLPLGAYAAGTVLRFRMDNLTSGQSFFTGPAAGNPDGIVHAAHAGWAADATIPVSGILVGFEDLLNGGDFDFDDNMFVFSNVQSDETGSPEPLSSVLVALGLAAVWTRHTRLGAAAARRWR